MRCAEYRDLVSAHVDGQLTEEETRRATAHVAECADCAHLLETQRAFTRVLRECDWMVPTPAHVRQRVLARIEAEERLHPRSERRAWWSLPSVRFALAGAVVLILALALALVRSRQQAPGAALFDTIIARYHAARSDRIELSLRTDDPMELRQYYYRAGAFPFTNSVVDLEPLGFVLVGGAVTDLDGRPSTLSLYRGPRGMVLCHRIPAAGVDLPAGGDVIGGDHFYTVDGITIFVHREGDVLCFLASDLPRAEFIRLLAGSGHV